ncbi:MAG: homocitrate synthase [Halanaerobiales bacterium]
MRDFYIVDSTLRDGEQTAGVAFSKKDKIDIARMLAEAGVDIIEAGIPAMGEEEIETIQEIMELDIESNIMAWNRMHIDDIKKSIDAGIKYLHISAPVSDIQIKSKLRKNREWILKNIEKTVSYAVKHNCIVSVGAEDASRAELDFLIKFYQTASRAGAVRVRYADTVGIMEPIKVYNTIKYIREMLVDNTFDIEIDFHGHNDFGMATANALSAYKAGAKYISCTINGLGERAGNTALEEIVMAAYYIEGVNTGFNLKKIVEISDAVEKASGCYLADSKPIVGKKVFSHESGIHVDGLLKDSRNYEAFPPEILGRERSIVLGKYSGRSAVINEYGKKGIKLDKSEAGVVLNKIRQSYFN